MKSARLNALYANYQAGPEIGLDPLLSAVRARAYRMLQDPDFAQDMTIDVWQLLPTLEIHTSFTAWLATRLRWRVTDQQRLVTREADRMQQPPVIIGEDDEPLSHDESLELVSYRWHKSTGQLAIKEPKPDLDSIHDPVIRQTADMILDGKTQAEVAAALNLKPATLRKRLQRFRDSKCHIRP